MLVWHQPQNTFFDGEIWKNRNKCHVLWFQIIAFSPFKSPYLFMSSGRWVRQSFPGEPSRPSEYQGIFNKSNRKGTEFFFRSSSLVASSSCFSEGKQILLWGLPTRSFSQPQLEDLRIIPICTVIYSMCKILGYCVLSFL